MGSIYIIWTQHFPSYDEYFKERSKREIDKAVLLENRVEETMKKAGFWARLTRKEKGSASNQKEVRSKKKQDPKNQGEPSK